ncbi:hypothetical protein BJX62DRAFT_219242 [Aspergillus germanicus]
MFQHQGLLGNVKEIYQDVLERYCHDGFMANTAYALTKLHIHEGKLKEAKGMYEQALAGNERTLGDSHGKTKIGLRFLLPASLCAAANI